MGMSIVNNIAAMGAQRALSTAGSAVGKSLAKLSSGLRINSAKDDPSGLAISERFRTQIRGLARASLNAQDAISFLQTAEGALNETHSILQRMRELSVQAANGVLTSSDREEIQKEVDQLGSEVDRIAKSTEFNTKKLLDGSSAALWSSDNSDMTAVITGTVAEGNYRLEKDATPVSNHVIKTDIFSVKSGAQGVTNTTTNTNIAEWSFDVAADAGTGANSLTFNLTGNNGDDLVVAYTGVATAGGNASAIASAINTDTDTATKLTATVSGSTVTVTMTNMADTEAVGSATLWESAGSFVASISDTAGHGTKVTTGADLHTAAQWSTSVAAVTTAGTHSLFFDFGAGEVEVANPLAIATADVTGADLMAAINADTNVNGNIAATYDAGTDTLVLYARQLGTTANSWTVREADDGTLAPANVLAAITAAAMGPTTAGNDDQGGITSIDNPTNLPAGTDFQINVESSTAGADDAVNLVDSYTQAGSTADFSNAVLATAAHTIATDDAGYLLIEVVSVTDASGIDSVANSTFRASTDGGQNYFNVAGTALGAGSNFTIGTSTFDLELTGNVQVGDKALFAYHGDQTAGNDTLQVTAPGQGSGPLYSYADATLPSASTTVEVATMDSNGNVSFGSVDVTFGATVSDGSIEFDITASGGLAQGSTQLYFVDRSYDNVGNFIWGDHGQNITIYNAEGDSADIFIDGADTIDEVAQKVENAIIGDKSAGGLGMSSGDSTVDGHVADFVGTATANSDEAVQGTIVIRSPKQGVNGKLFFSAQEDVLKFFSFADIQDPRDDIDPLTVTVYNAHTGALVGSDTVSDNVLRNVIEGVDVYIDSNVDIDVAWNATTRSYDFTSSAGVQTDNLHVVDASTSFQIGANRGQTTVGYIAQMDAKALGVNNVLVINQEVASLAIEKVDNAINKVSSERARIGGNISRLEHTINNLNVQAENAVAAESRIRDLDLALEMSEFTKQQLLLQASTAMLAQANQVPQILLQLLR